ncbi:MAG: helix-turn-helix transcriptional regulator [Mesorhizobium sp.]|nr:helix-turn-helix transcriptional regulator [Mesorhizobium sp.]
MVEQTARLDTVFHALSDGTRRGMLQALEGGEKAIGDLARPYAMSFAGASKHVRVLEQAGLVRRRISGRTHYCSLDAARLREANEWLRRYERFWGDRLDILDNLLRQEDEANNT